jgi:hypothetical protein
MPSRDREDRQQKSPAGKFKEFSETTEGAERRKEFEQELWRLAVGALHHDLNPRPLAQLLRRGQAVPEGAQLALAEMLDPMVPKDIQAAHAKPKTDRQIARVARISEAARDAPWLEAILMLAKALPPSAALFPPSPVKVRLIPQRTDAFDRWTARYEEIRRIGDAVKKELDGGATVSQAVKTVAAQSKGRTKRKRSYAGVSERWVYEAWKLARIFDRHDEIAARGSPFQN